MAYKDPEKQRRFQREWFQVRSARMRETKNELKAGGCIVCGERELCCLDFHHVDPSTKSFRLGSTGTGHAVRTPENVRKEAKKCVVLCANCHRKLHAGVIEIRLDGESRQDRGAEPRASTMPLFAAEGGYVATGDD